MPTFVLSTPTPSGDPGAAAWQDATTLPAPALFTPSVFVGVIVPPILAGLAFTTSVTVVGAVQGAPVIVGWGATATPIKVLAHAIAADTVELYIEAPDFQGFAGGAVPFQITAYIGP